MPILSTVYLIRFSLMQTSSERDRIILNDITELRESSENRHQMYVTFVR